MVAAAMSADGRFTLAKHTGGSMPPTVASGAGSLKLENEQKRV